MSDCTSTAGVEVGADVLVLGSQRLYPNPSVRLSDVVNVSIDPRDLARAIQPQVEDLGEAEELVREDARAEAVAVERQRVAAVLVGRDRQRVHVELEEVA